MRFTIPTRRRAAYWLLATLVISQLLSIGIAPQAASAATSAEPSDEIVYLDNDGVIRVWDLEEGDDGGPYVEWYSPSDAWEQLSLGDFNDDGDIEIAALRQVGDDFQWAVFDPVVALGGGKPGQEINGIPWDTLYESTPERGIIKFIEAGNFDNNIPGDELIIGWRDDNQRHYVRVVKAAALGNDGKPTGRQWQTHLQKDFAQRYSFAASGQLNGGGADEVVLIDSDSAESSIDIYQVDNDFARIDGKRSDSDTYRQAAVGQIIADGPEEIAVGLSVTRPDKESLIVYEMEPEGGVYEMASDEDWQWAFAPNPYFVFLADLFGNGDEEVVFLRKYPEGNEGPRLLMRDDWGSDRDRYDEEEEPLEASLKEVDGLDNSYLTGVGADVDGDGKDEVVILREDRIVVFRQPDSTLEGSTTVKDDISANNDFVFAGDLDAIGVTEGPVFGVSQSLIEAEIPVGTRSGNYQLTVENISTSDNVTFRVTVPFDAPWVQVNPTIATTPATINVTFDAMNLQAGVYSTAIRVEADNVLNSPYLIDIALTVLPAVIQPMPNAVAHINNSCGIEGGEDGPFTKTIRVGGTTGLNYRAALIAVPDETAAASQTAGFDSTSITSAQINEAGEIVIRDAQGNSRTIATGIPSGLPAGGDVSASAVLSTSWPIDETIDWVTSVSSDQTSVPSTITIVMDTSVLGDQYELTQAVLVLVADSRAGTPPDNFFAVPVYTFCAVSNLSLPVMR